MRFLCDPEADGGFRILLLQSLAWLLESGLELLEQRGEHRASEIVIITLYAIGNGNDTRAMA